MSTLEYELTKLLSEFDNNNKLCLANLENCEIILARYKNKLYRDHLSYKFELHLQGDSTTDAKVILHENFNSDGENVEKIDIEFKGNKVLKTRHEVSTERRDTHDGMKLYVFYRFYIDNYLILQRERDRKFKDILKFNLVTKFLQDLGINTSVNNFLQATLKLYTDSSVLQKFIDQLEDPSCPENNEVVEDTDSDIAMDFD
jgi:hypothetical protein